MSFLIKESLADTVMVYLIIKKLSKPFPEWEAYKLGLIDADGKKLKTAMSFKERRAWTVFDRFIANLKKIMSKFVGKSRFAAIATAAYMLRDSKTILYTNDLLNESKDELGLTANTQLKIKQLMNDVQIEAVDLKDEVFFTFMVERNMNKMITQNIDFLKMGEFEDE